MAYNGLFICCFIKHKKIKTSVQTAHMTFSCKFIDLMWGRHCFLILIVASVTDIILIKTKRENLMVCFRNSHSAVLSVINATSLALGCHNWLSHPLQVSTIETNFNLQKLHSQLAWSHFKENQILKLLPYLAGQHWSRSHFLNIKKYKVTWLCLFKD